MKDNRDEDKQVFSAFVVVACGVLSVVCVVLAVIMEAIR